MFIQLYCLQRHLLFCIQDFWHPAIFCNPLLIALITVPYLYHTTQHDGLVYDIENMTLNSAKSHTVSYAAICKRYSTVKRHQST